MTTRNGISRNSPTSRAHIRTHQDGVNFQSLASRDADIKRFTELMRSKRESHNKITPAESSQSEELPRDENVLTNATIVSTQPANRIVTNSLQLSIDIDPGNQPSDQQHIGQLAKLNVGTITVESAPNTHTSRSTQTVVSILDRIMQTNTSVPSDNTWTVDIVLDKNTRFQLQLQPRGKHEWILQINPDDQNKKQSPEIDTEYFEKFTLELKQELSKTKSHVTVINNTHS